MPLLLGNEVKKGKVSQREQRHGAQTPNSRHRHKMLEGYTKQTSTKQPKGFPPLENGLVGKGLNEPPNSQRCNQCGIITHIHNGVRQY
jgi:hypothetical protein